MTSLSLRRLGSRLVAAAQLVLWLYLYLALVLGAWIGLGWGIGGWSPVVVTTGSMAPSIDPGDVLMIETEPEIIGQRAIMVFERGGDHIAHRVFSVEEEGYRTKGDANPAPDAAIVPAEAVVGVGRLLVPVIGLPVVWQERGDILPLGAWAVVTMSGVIHMVLVGRGVLRRRAGPRPGRAVVNAAQAGIRRVRGLVALLIAAHAVLDPSRFDVLGDPDKRSWMIATTLVLLAGTNLLSSVRGSERPVSPVAELAVDSALVVLLATFTGTSGIGWVLFALPIIEAAVQYRLVGALTTWIALTAVTLITRIWAVQWTGNAALLDELEALVDQLSVLFLVIIPTSYLAEQLMNDVAVQQSATSRAVQRGALLESVAQAGFRVTRLGGEPISAIVDGTAALGFDAVDVVMTSGGGAWSPIAAAGTRRLPDPGGAASGLKQHDLGHDAVVVDLDDPDPAEVRALAVNGLNLVLAQTVSSEKQERLVLRAGVTHGRHVGNDQIEAFRLLAGQASIALQNDDLLRQLRSTRDDLEHQAHHDALTGLPNRVLLLERAGVALAKEGDRPALLFLDLNGFKPVNDRLGHEMGDVLLRLVGKRLTNVAPERCLVSRLGGDEFTLLLSGRVSDDEARSLAEAVWNRIREPFELNGDIVHISTSIGVAFGQQGMGHSELIRRADVAMYEAKNRSKDPSRDGLAPGEIVYQVYRPDLDREEQRRGLLAAAIAPALSLGHIRVDYQSIHLLTGPAPVVGFEAMLRWHHDEIGEIEQTEIQEVAQSAGLRDAVNALLVSRVCHDAAGWATRHPGRDLFVTFQGWADNGGTGLIDNLTRALHDTGLEPDRIRVEMGERIVGTDLSALSATMSALEWLGVGIILDDFGQGRIALSALHQLPLSGVKLAPEMVATLARSETDRIVLGSIVDLCRRLGLEVMADGLTDPWEVETLTGLGCDLGQGPLLGFPELSEHIDTIVDARRFYRPETTVPRTPDGWN